MSHCQDRDLVKWLEVLSCARFNSLTENTLVRTQELTEHGYSIDRSKRKAPDDGICQC